MPGSGTLRFKPAAQSTDSHRFKRRRAEKDEDSAAADEYAPARPHAGPSRRHDIYSIDPDQLDDEGSIPPAQATKAAAVDDEAQFSERLYQEMFNDEGADAWSSLYDVDPPSTMHVPHRWRAEGSRVGVHAEKTGLVSPRTVKVVNERGAILTRVIFEEAMTDQEYAEHIRSGMYRRTNADEIRRQEAMRKESVAKEEQARLDRERMRKEEADRVKRLEETIRRRDRAHDDISRERYQAAWTKLLDPATADAPLTAKDFVWPLPSETALDKDSIERFLVGHIPSSEARARRGALRMAVLAYHPDRFDRLLARIANETERAAVRDMGLRISQLLNELLAAAVV